MVVHLPIHDSHTEIACINIHTLKSGLIRILTYEVGMALFNITCQARANKTYSHFIKSESLQPLC